MELFSFLPDKSIPINLCSNQFVKQPSCYRVNQGTTPALREYSVILSYFQIPGNLSHSDNSDPSYLFWRLYDCVDLSLVQKFSNINSHNSGNE